MLPVSSSARIRARYVSNVSSLHAAMSPYSFEMCPSSDDAFEL